MPLSMYAVQSHISDIRVVSPLLQPVRGTLPLRGFGREYPIEKKLVVAIASSALFDLAESDTVYRKQGRDAYRRYQRRNERKILRPGVAFPFIKRLLSLRAMNPKDPPVEVVLLSRNDPDTGLRVFNSIEKHGLDISRAAFTSGEQPYLYMTSFNACLFLSANGQDVRDAIAHGQPAGLVPHGHHVSTHGAGDSVRVPVDGAQSDSKATLSDSKFLNRVWAAAYGLCEAKKPAITKEIKQLERQMDDIRLRIDKYMTAFETGEMKVTPAENKVQELQRRLEQLDSEKAAQEAKLGALNLPDLDQASLAKALELLEKTMKSSGNPEKKSLMRHLIKKMVVHNRSKLEVDYCIPSPHMVIRMSNLAPQPAPSKMPTEGEVWFRIVHDATALPYPVTTGFRIAQPVGVTVGPVVAFRPDMTVSLSRQVPALRVIHPALPGRGISQKTTAAQKAPRPLPVAETIKRARAWDELLKSGQVKNRAEIARREGLSRARVTQIMMLLRVPDNVLDQVMATQTRQRGLLGELDLRRLSDRREQMKAVQAVLSVNCAG